MALAHLLDAPAPDTRVDPPWPSGARELIALARQQSADDRQRLLLSVAALCQAAPRGQRTTAILGDVFVTLAGQAERDIRKALARHLAEADWAPRALVNMLVLDEIEIARPLIESSPLLGDAELLRILVEATLEHQIAVASRPRLSGRVADAIIDGGEAAVLTALASNSTAEVGEGGLRRLVEHSRRITSLRAPLARHPALNAALAREMRQWVGDTLRQAIEDRFRIDGAALSAAIDHAVGVSAPGWTAAPLAIDGADDAERREMERRLVAKLQASGQLRPGFLVRALRERRPGLFEQALAALGGFSLAHVRAAVRAPTPEPLSLACAAVGVDRAAFTDVLTELRKLTGGWPAGGPVQTGPQGSSEEAASAFAALFAEPRLIEPAAN